MQKSTTILRARLPLPEHMILEGRAPTPTTNMYTRCTSYMAICCAISDAKVISVWENFNIVLERLRKF